MRIEKNVAVPISDGIVLRANVYRPADAGRHPVLLAQGVYGKDVHFADAFAPQWKKLTEQLHPGLCKDGSSGRYLRWEIVDPERWVPEGYIVVQVDSRGTGQSPGFLDPFSPREMRDYYEAIEWAGTQPWSNGKVGLIGISYYAITQWQVAALRPPHLAAIVPWEGGSDHYRDFNYHGGMQSNTFSSAWWPRQVLANQHGNGATTHRDRETDLPTTLPALPPAMLEGNRSWYPELVAAHTLDDHWHRERSPVLEHIEVPLLSAGNWSGPGMHLRGNIEGFMRAGSKQKWLSMHVGTHYESFYLPRYIALQKRFLDHFLKGVDNGWNREPPVRIDVRRVDGAVERKATAFPLPGTQWTRYYLDAQSRRLSTTAPAAQAQSSFEALGAGIDFTTEPFERETEFTGFVTLHLHAASSTTDMDLFATLRAFDPEGREVVFDGAHEPVPVARGWLRASHRKVDAARSLPHRVFHSHDEVQKLVPGETVALDIEIWPTSVVLPRGYRLQLSITGRDLEVPRIPGRILHTNPAERAGGELGGTTTVLSGGATASFLLLPFIPA